MTVQVLDFGAYRDGIPASQRGSRHLLIGGDAEADRVVVEATEQAAGGP